MAQLVHDHWRKAALLLFAAAMLVAWMNMDVSLADMLAAQHEMAIYFMENPTLVTLVYFSVFVLLTALCLPGAGVLMLVGGGCMGFGLCMLVSTAASAFGALLTMLFARHVFRARVEQRFASQLEHINKGLEKNEVTYLLSLRLAPVIPFVVFNLLAGLARIKPWTFLWTSFLGMLPGTMLYVNAGTELSAIKSLGDLFTLEVILSLTALALVPLLLNWCFRRVDTSAQRL
jgi:uncharacterized membrane protein YdjX (TVP38/TMEM64 family)